MTNMELFFQKQYLKFDFNNLNEDQERFIRNFQCNCEDFIILPSGLRYCKHLVDALKRRFSKKEVELAKKTISVKKREQNLFEIA